MKFFMNLSTSRAYIMKIAELLSPGILAALLLTATCSRNPAGPNLTADEQAVAADKNALEISYMAGDSAGSVTRMLGLPDSGANGSIIAWATDDSSRITTDGKVTRPSAGSGNVVVTLTATLSRGTASEVKVFTLTVKERPAPVTDIDGNIYQTVEIGDQVWTTENLRTTRYNDGTPILWDTADASWAQGTTGKYCFYWNTTNADTVRRFGALYNWYAVDSKKLAPAGWHVPDTTEWNVLENYLIANGFNWDGTTMGNKIARSLASETDWGFYSILGTIGRDLTLNNSSGFTGIPAGSRYITNFEENAGYDGYWWSASAYDSTDACYRFLYGNSIGLRNGHDYKACGFSVRLLKD
jgi:uncharacterized protein (TIGR02145 family)